MSSADPRLPSANRESMISRSRLDSFSFFISFRRLSFFVLRPQHSATFVACQAAPRRWRCSAAVQHGLRYNGGMRVLVVEDEALLSQQLARALGDAGYAVDCAADGERADFLGQTAHYDAAL